VAARLAAAEIITKRQEFCVTEGREVTAGFGSQVSDSGLLVVLQQYVIERPPTPETILKLEL
jgi:hypothetical protein